MAFYGTLLNFIIQNAAKRSISVDDKQLDMEITIKNLKEEAKDDYMDSGVTVS